MQSESDKIWFRLNLRFSQLLTSNLTLVKFQDLPRPPPPTAPELYVFEEPVSKKQSKRNKKQKAIGTVTKQSLSIKRPVPQPVPVNHDEVYRYIVKPALVMINMLELEPPLANKNVLDTALYFLLVTLNWNSPKLSLCYV